MCKPTLYPGFVHPWNFTRVLMRSIWIGVPPYLDKHSIGSIKIKKHGRRAKSLFKYGLTYLSKVLFSNDIYEFIKCCKFLSCT